MRRAFLESDLSLVETADDLHRALLIALTSPGYYGHNWNAFWDCIPEGRLPQRLRLVGRRNVLERFSEYARHMRECLERLGETDPDVGVRVEWVLDPKSSDGTIRS